MAGAGFRVYTNNKAITIRNFQVLSIQVFAGTVTLTSDTPQDPSTDFITLSAEDNGYSDTFTWPQGVQPWEEIQVSAGGSYQLYTAGGTITEQP